MPYSTHETLKRLTIIARPPAIASVIAPALLGVEIDNDEEEVRWHWTHFVDGRSMVTGYSIVSRSKN
ncbi:MAG TPA: hypothetical protein VMP01_07220 [Pirellulaceae bacterium]|nr:hypothetical protein [Pirellulaceae bacterium]